MNGQSNNPNSCRVLVRIFLGLILFCGTKDDPYAQNSARLNKSQVLDMTREANRKPKARTMALNEVVKAVRQDGVDFALTKKDEVELRAAGANLALISAVRRAYRSSDDVARNSSVNKRPTRGTNAPPPPSYEELLSQAQRELEVKNYADGLTVLQRAIRRDATRPTAYEWIADVQYNVMKNQEMGAEAMYEALARGGIARLAIAHYHNAGIGCYGVLVIRPASVSFETDNSNDRFMVTKDGIYENWTRDDGDLHLRVRKSDGGERNFNFSTKNRFESDLIIALIKKYR